MKLLSFVWTQVCKVGNAIPKGLVMAVLGAVWLPILAIVQTPNFDVFTTNWSAVIVLGINGAIVAAVTYVNMRVFQSTDNNKVFGKIG